MKTKQKAAPGTFAKVMKRIRGHWPLLAISILCAAANVFLTLYIPVVNGRAIDFIIGEGQVDLSGVLNTLRTVLVCAGLAAAAQWLMNICNNRMTFAIVRDIRNDAMQKIEILPLSYLDSHPHGEIVSRVIADVDQFADGLLMGFTQLFSGILMILGTLASTPQPSPSKSPRRTCPRGTTCCAPTGAASASTARRGRTRSPSTPPPRTPSCSP